MLKRTLLMLLAISLSATAAVAGDGRSRIGVFPAPPVISASVSFTEPSGNKVLDAEETGKLTITVDNSGKGDAFDVKAELKANKSIKGLNFEKAVSFGTIASGRSSTKEITLRAAENMPTDEVTFDIRVLEANGFDANPLRIAFSTRAFEPPKLIIADMGIEDFSGNSKVEPLENVEITVRVQNVGHGDARDVRADVVNGQNVFIGGDGVTHFDIGALKAGQFRDIKFMFYTNKRINNGEVIPISINIAEQRPEFKVASALDLRMNARQKRVEEIVVKGEDAPKGNIELAKGLSVDVDMKIPAGMKAGRDDVAVVIGNRNYTAPGVYVIDYADRDARIMKEYLITTFGFRSDNIIYAEDATLSKFNEIFGTAGNHNGRLNRFVRPGVSNVFIYYVGHGAPDLDSAEAYFVPVDANPQFMAANGYALQTFYDNLSKVPAKSMTIVLDSCFSGNSEKGMLFKGISPAMVKVKKQYRGPANASVLTSAAVDQVSSWYPEKGHSLFTYYFLKGLQGGADSNGDRKISVGEMKAYLSENVPYMARRLSGVEQNPVVKGNETDVLVTLK